MKVCLAFLFIVVKAVPLKKAQLTSGGSHILHIPGNLPDSHSLEISSKEHAADSRRLKKKSLNGKQ